MSPRTIACRVIFSTFLVTAATPPTLNGADRPNILWLIAEDLGPAMSCYGNKEVRTPHLDRLASEGARYTRAYTTAPVCSASRSAFMTGMYQTTIGAQNHRSHRGDGYMQQRQPFCAQLNFHETHRPFHPKGKVDPQNVTVPPYYPDHPVTRTDRAAYLDDVLELDRKVGVVLEELNHSGLADSTLVIFMGDHGEAQVRGKQFCYEEGLHIPLLIRWPKNFAAPKQISAGKVDSRFIEAIDIAPTLLNIAGISKPSKMQGRNFLGDNPDTERPCVFGARDRCDETVFRLRTVRDERYRYIHNFTSERPFLQPNAYKERAYPGWNLMKELHAQGKLTPEQAFLCQPHMPEEELYDLENDPHEILNLATSKNPEHQDVLRRMRELLDAWISDTQDQGAVFESEEVIASQTRSGKRAK